MERRFGGPRRDFGRGPRRFGGGNRFNRPREMHKAVCAKCGNECEVPFKPTEGRPVFCRDCFQRRNNRFDRSEESEGFENKKSKHKSKEVEESEETSEVEESEDYEEDQESEE